MSARSITAAMLATALTFGLAGAVASTCEALGALKLPKTTIEAATAIAEGAFIPPGTTTPPSEQSPFKTMPAFCRVAGVIAPTSDSHIQFEVWMPVRDWNGKLQGSGNGGFAGVISYPQLAGPMRMGYAVALTDTGHTGGDAKWAVGHPDKVVDYGYRGIHEMTEKAKAIVAAFYGSGPKKSYFSSCSNGGRQALMEAQRYPEDYDGIIAGAPANDFTHLMSSFAANALALMSDPASYIPAAKLNAIEAAALAACDANDGVKDGVLDDPTRCRFDPSVLLCKDGDSDSCLTAPQLAALKKIYTGPITARGKRLFPGYLPGGETGFTGWAGWITGMAPGRSAQFSFAIQFFGNMVFGDPNWDYKTFELNRDVRVADNRLSLILNAVDPNLKAFRARGGKLILWQGWSDAAIAPERTIQYYQAVRSKMGEKAAAEFVRLYMVPGMQHCAAGPGPNVFGAVPGSPQANPENDMSAALERWVESGTPPGSIVAAKLASDFDPLSKVLRTRPLCVYPQVARYVGSGSTDDAENFRCEAAPRAKR
ncbi:MAG: tannase/feruloyl esterase family alpha/beta hydrolase [Bryobacteraceae bacterium]